MIGGGSTLFRVIPAVDLKDGKVVRLRQGREEDVTVQIENPVEVAEMWVKRGARVLHVIDLDGAFRGRLKHEDIIFEIRKRVGAEIQVGGGIRSIEIAKRLIDAGIDRVIMGTLAVRNVESVRGFAKEYPGKVMIAVDSKRDRVVVEGWRKDTGMNPLDIAKIYEDLEVSLLYTNVDVEGLVSGIVIEKITELVESTSLPVYVAGGITTREDVRKIKETGAVGVIIGSALYLGKLRLEDVIDLEED